MSSIPVQFLINVLPLPECSLLPVILPIISCLEVQVGEPVNLTLFAINNCNTSRTIITDIFISMGMAGMTSSDLVNDTTNASVSYITINWIPQSDQIGPQILCAIAYTEYKFSFLSF